MLVKQLIYAGDKEFLFNEIDETFEVQVIELFKSCSDFFELIGGVSSMDTDHYFKDIPPGKVYDEKHLIGVFDDARLIAAIDIVENYPKDKEWIIGLLVIHPDYRQLGLGRKIDEVLGKIVVENRGRFLRVGVQEHNEIGLKFWHNLGYQKKSITKPMLIGKLKSCVVVMDKRL